MDTRSKILTFDAALRLPRGAVTLVSGYFDALRAAHVRDLTGLGAPLLAAVLPCDGELFPQSARAEMVAALRVIDYVVITNEKDLDALIECLAPRELRRLEAADAARVRQLRDHVQTRKTFK
jgi:hypothetical protein